MSQVLKSVPGLVWLCLAGLHRLWRRRRKPRAAPPILVVGSTRAGGTGKTDLVEWIATRHPQLAVLAHPTGDEDAWLKSRLGDRVFVDRDLLKAWDAAHQAGFAMAVSDGGLQDPALEECPALCLELDDSAVGWADLLPFGRFREPSPRPRQSLERPIWGRDVAWRLDPASLPEHGTEIVAACAIARPEAFFADLERYGLVMLERLAFSDHSRFTRMAVARAKASHPGARWVITEKDHAREGQALPAGTFVARRILSISDGLSERIDGWLSGQSRNRTHVTPRG